jgi:hypothetical protein
VVRLHKRSWLVQGYDGLEPIFQRKLPSSMSEKEIGALLQRLAARDLSVSETINASLRKGMRARSSALEVKREHRQRFILSCGENPHYIASLHTEDEFADDPDFQEVS